MRTIRIGLTVAIILALASLTAVVPKALAGDHECSVKLLEGSFGYALQHPINVGSTVTPDTFIPIGDYALAAYAGTITFDGKGNMHGVDSINFGWGGFPRTYQGTYTVVDANAKPEDCAFTTTFTDSLALTHDLYMVLAADGNVVEFVNTDTNVILAGKLDRKLARQR